MTVLQRYCQLAAGLALLSLVGVARGGSTPSTQPDAVQFRNWITQLADPDPDVRATAAENLMGLTRADLPALRDAALSQRPLLPVQVDTLHDVVRQVYLTAEPYRATPRTGFLGLYWPLAQAIADPRGVVVVDRIPGFDVYRRLRAGDVIVKFDDLPDYPLHGSADLSNIVQKFSAGDKLLFDVLRDGRVVSISVLLQAHPDDIPQNPEPWLGRRALKADQYWEKNFYLLDHDVATTEASSAP
jgi:hypothetical protein